MFVSPDSPPVNTAVKSDKKAAGNSIFSWLFVLAMLGVWLSVGVVWFDLVDYDNVVGKYGLKNICDISLVS